MRKALLCSLLVVFVVIPLTGQTEGWKKYKFEAGNFTVLFPSDPQDSVNKKDDVVESHTLLARQTPYIYTVIYTAMASDQKVDDATYEVFKNAVFKELPTCEVRAERPAVPALSGYIGHWYRLDCDMSPNKVKVTVLGDLYWGRRYAYAVMVMFQSKEAEPQAANQFLWSFGLMDLQK